MFLGSIRSRGNVGGDCVCPIICGTYRREEEDRSQGSEGHPDQAGLEVFRILGFRVWGLGLWFRGLGFWVYGFNTPCHGQSRTSQASPGRKPTARKAFKGCFQKRSGLRSIRLKPHACFVGEVAVLNPHS